MHDISTQDERQKIERSVSLVVRSLNCTPRGATTEAFGRSPPNHSQPARMVASSGFGLARTCR